MKILVLSDSHSGMSFMRRCVDSVQPDAMIHLGDYYEDGKTLASDYPNIPIHQVPGNCDRYRVPQWIAQTLCCEVCGVNLFMTHGHLHGVKSGTELLLEDARRHKAQAVLYGHTHVAQCTQEADGLWVLNPGSCSSYGGSAGLILVENGDIKSCQLLSGEDTVQHHKNWLGFYKK